MRQIVLFSVFRRAPNVLFSAFRRAPNRALFCVSSCAKSRAFQRFVVRQIVLFSAFRRAPNRAKNLKRTPLPKHVINPKKVALLVCRTVWVGGCKF